MQGGGGRKGERWVWCAGAGRTGSSAPARLLICFLRGWPPGRSDLGMCRISCNACHCETGDRCHRCGDPVPPALRLLCLRRLPFFLQRKKGRKERRQNQGFGILFAAGVSSTSVSSYLADRDVQNLHLAFAWSLRRHPLAAHAGPRCPDAAGKRFASAVLCATFLVIVS